MTQTVTVQVVAQQVRVLAARFAVGGDELDAATTLPVVRVSAPDGDAVVREDPDGPWRALFTGASAHGLDVPGMTVSLLAPLAAAGVSVFVASTATADLVFVPDDALVDAAAALRAVGHAVVQETAESPSP